MAGTRDRIFRITDRLDLGYLDNNTIHGNNDTQYLIITSASGIRCSGNVTIPTGNTFTVDGGAVTLGTGVVSIGGSTTLTEDLTRRSLKLISGTTIQSGYTSCTSKYALPDEGVIIFNGISGQMLPYLGAGTLGNQVTMIFSHSGAGTGYTTVVSSATLFRMPAGTYSFMTFTDKYEQVTLTSDGSYWYPTQSGSSTNSNMGPTFS